MSPGVSDFAPGRRRLEAPAPSPGAATIPSVSGISPVAAGLVAGALFVAAAPPLFTLHAAGAEADACHGGR